VVPPLNMQRLKPSTAFSRFVRVYWASRSTPQVKGRIY